MKIKWNRIVGPCDFRKSHLLKKIRKIQNFQVTIQKRTVICLMHLFYHIVDFISLIFGFIALRALPPVTRLTVHWRLWVSDTWPPKRWFLRIFLQFVLVWNVTRSFETLLAIGECIHSWYGKTEWFRKVWPVDLKTFTVLDILNKIIFFVRFENHIPRFRIHSIASSDARKIIIIEFRFLLLFQTLMFSDFLEEEISEF